MGSFLSCFFEWLFQDSHSDEEFAYFLLLGIIGYIAYTYWDASRASIKAMKEEYELVYGPCDDSSEIAYNYNFDEIWEQMQTRKITLQQKSEQESIKKRYNSQYNSERKGSFEITKENNLNNTDSIQEINEVDKFQYFSLESIDDRDKEDKDGYSTARSRRQNVVKVNKHKNAFEEN